MVIKDTRKARSDIIFSGPVGPINIAQLARKTKIPASTLYKWRQDPDGIHARELGILFMAVRATDEDILRFFGRGEK